MAQLFWRWRIFWWVYAATFIILALAFWSVVFVGFFHTMMSAGPVAASSKTTTAQAAEFLLGTPFAPTVQARGNINIRDLIVAGIANMTLWSLCGSTVAAGLVTAFLGIRKA